MRKGARHSEVAKQKVREAKEGKKRPPFSKKWRENLSNSSARKGKSGAFKGKHHAEATKRKMSRDRKGRTAWNRGLTAATDPRVNSGENHGCWAGGFSKEPYPFEWTETLKEAIRQRDSYICQLCHIPQRELLIKLCVHHIDYDKNNLDPRNLISLCNADNIRVNSNRKKWIKFFSIYDRS